MRTLVKKAILFACLSVFCACSLPSSRLAFIHARLLASRGQSAEAIAVLLPLVADEELSPWASYELGTIYLSLGETGSAKRQFEKTLSLTEQRDAPASSSLRELAFRARFNASLALYRERDFPQAAIGFRRALEIDEGRIEAKRNLELSLEEIITESQRASARSLVQEGMDNSPGMRSLVEFLREGEKERWESTRWKGDDTTWPDY